MIYYRFPKEIATKVVDYRINSIENSRIIKISDIPTKEKIFFVGGPFSSLQKIQQILKNSANYINIDKGYLRNKKVNSHWRMTFNNLQQTKIFDVPGDRFDKCFNIKIKNWKKTGSYILILAPNPQPLRFYYNTEDVFSWALQIKNNLLAYTDKKIFIRFKNATTKREDPLIKYLDECYAIVTLQSIGVVEAIIEGIPVVTLGDSCADSLCKQHIEDIEKLQYPDNRYEWLKSLTYSQFTESEMKSGYALDILENHYNLK